MSLNAVFLTTAKSGSCAQNKKKANGSKYVSARATVWLCLNQPAICQNAEIANTMFCPCSKLSHVANLSGSSRNANPASKIERARYVITSHALCGIANRVGETLTQADSYREKTTVHAKQSGSVSRLTPARSSKVSASPGSGCASASPPTKSRSETIISRTGSRMNQNWYMDRKPRDAEQQVHALPSVQCGNC